MDRHKKHQIFLSLLQTTQPVNAKEIKPQEIKKFTTKVKNIKQYIEESNSQTIQEYETIINLFLNIRIGVYDDLLLFKNCEDLEVLKNVCFYFVREKVYLDECLDLFVFCLQFVYGVNNGTIDNEWVNLISEFKNFSVALSWVESISKLHENYTTQVFELLQVMVKTVEADSLMLIYDLLFFIVLKNSRFDLNLTDLSKSKDELETVFCWYFKFLATRNVAEGKFKSNFVNEIPLIHHKKIIPLLKHPSIRSINSLVEFFLLDNYSIAHTFDYLLFSNLSSIEISEADQELCFKTICKLLSHLIDNNFMAEYDDFIKLSLYTIAKNPSYFYYLDNFILLFKYPQYHSLLLHLISALTSLTPSEISAHSDKYLMILNSILPFTKSHDIIFKHTFNIRYLSIIVCRIIIQFNEVDLISLLLFNVCECDGVVLDCLFLLRDYFKSEIERGKSLGGVVESVLVSLVGFLQQELLNRQNGVNKLKGNKEKDGGEDLGEGKGRSDFIVVRLINLILEFLTFDNVSDKVYKLIYELFNEFEGEEIEYFKNCLFCYNSIDSSNGKAGIDNQNSGGNELDWCLCRRNVLIGTVGDYLVVRNIVGKFGFKISFDKNEKLENKVNANENKEEEELVNTAFGDDGFYPIKEDKDAPLPEDVEHMMKLLNFDLKDVVKNDEAEMWNLIDKLKLYSDIYSNNLKEPLNKEAFIELFDSDTVEEKEKEDELTYSDLSGNRNRLFLKCLGLLDYDSFDDILVLNTGTSGFSRDLKGLDRVNSLECIKAAILYIPNGITDEVGILSVERNQTSAEFKKFVSLLGWDVELTTHTGFMAGLDKNGSNGTHANYYCTSTLELMFHDVTRMQNDPADPKHLKKKRHVGNDCVHIFWNENNIIKDKWIGGDFGNCVIIINPIGNCLYAVKVKKDMECDFGPLLEWNVLDLNILGLYVRHTCINAYRKFVNYGKDYTWPFEQRLNEIKTISKRHSVYDEDKSKENYDKFISYFDNLIVEQELTNIQILDSPLLERK